MTYPLTYTPQVPTSRRRVGLLANLRDARANRVERVRARRTALAVSEAARIQAQTRNPRIR